MAEFLLSLRIVVAIILYAFLGLSVYIMWRGLQKEESSPPPIPKAAYVTVEAGVDMGEQLELLPITAVGRAEDNTLILDDPFASNHHAMIMWRDGCWWLEDLESHNGTLLNNEQISKAMPLTSGDRINIGETTLSFEIERSPTPPD